MSDQEEWGPWVEHDGVSVAGLIPRTCQLQIICSGSGVTPEEGETVGASWPGFFWRWKSVKTGWFSSKMRRLCDDPSFAPIIRYRVRKPRGLVILQGLLENLPVEVDA